MIDNTRSEFRENAILAILTLYNVCSVHRGDPVSTFGDMLSTSGGGGGGGAGGYHDSCGGAS